jgi:hypothetical protein
MASRNRRGSNAQGALTKDDLERASAGLQAVMRQLHPEIKIGFDRLEAIILGHKPPTPPKMPDGLGKVIEGFSMMQAGLAEMTNKKRR